MVTGTAATAPVILAPGEGHTFSTMGIRICPKVRAEDTGGVYCLIAQTVAPEASSPPHKTAPPVDGARRLLVCGWVCVS